MPTVAFLIPTLNSEKTIERCLESILAVDYPSARVQIWVIDGFSQDHTVEKASRFPVNVKQVAGNPAIAYNSVLNEVTTDFVALVDSDATISRDWLSKLVNTAIEERADAVGSNIRSWNPETRWSKTIGEELEARYSGFPRAVNRIATTCLLVRTEALKRIGGFDTSLVTGYDVALGYALEKSGISIAFNRDTYVYHMHRASVPAYIRQQFQYGRSGVRLTRKWPRALAGDQVTPLWMTIQPLLIAVFVVGEAGALLHLATRTFFWLLGTACATLLGLIWIGWTMRVFLLTRKAWTLVMMIPVQVLRAESWSFGILAGVCSAVTSVVKSRRRGSRHK